jgi:hypothetical protein
MADAFHFNAGRLLTELFVSIADFCAGVDVDQYRIHTGFQCYKVDRREG